MDTTTLLEMIHRHELNYGAMTVIVDGKEANTVTISGYGSGTLRFEISSEPPKF